MSYVSQMLRRGLLPLSVAASALGLAPIAGAASLDAPVLCKYPLGGTVKATLTVAGDLPSSIPGSTPSAPVPLAVKLSVASTLSPAQVQLEALHMTGNLALRMAVTPANGIPIAVKVAVGLGVTDIPESTGGYPAFEHAGTGQFPSLTIDDAGHYSIDVTGLSMNLRIESPAGEPLQLPQVNKDIDGNPLPDSDGDPNTYDIPCRFDPPVASKVLSKLDVVPATCPPAIYNPVAPIAESLSDADVGSTSVRLHWGASVDDSTDCLPPATSYKITYGDKTVTVPASQLETTISGLAPSTAYAFKIEALGAFGPGVGGNAITVNVTTDATPVEPKVKYAYDLAGSATLKTLTKGTLPLKGAIAAELTLSTGAFTADLTLNQTQGRLTALGFLPVTAKIGFIPSGKTTGTLLDGVLKTSSLVRIKVQEVKLFGAIPLVGGNNCQTKSLSKIDLKSTQAEFSPLDGGPIAGTFAISDLNGCGALNGLVSPLTAGGGNTINLNLTPKA